MKKKLSISNKRYIFIFMILILTALSLRVFSQTVTGYVWIQPSQIITRPNMEFETEIYINTGDYVLGAYDFEIYFDDDILSVDISKGDNGIIPGENGFVTAVDVSTTGIVKVSGFDPVGKGPGQDLSIFTIYWITHDTTGISILDLVVNTLEDTNSMVIGNPPYGLDSDVTVFLTEMGDVNKTDTIDIVDALLVAQFYVGLSPFNFYSDVADFNQTGSIDIIDSLLIAQYYVELITDYPTPTPTPTPEGYPPEVTPDLSNLPQNWLDMAGFIQINDNQKNKCVDNGFVVLSNISSNTLSRAYANISEKNNIPLFVTTDSLLHLFHITYAHMTEVVEKTELYDLMVSILDALNTSAAIEYNSIPGDRIFVKNAALKLWEYTAIAQALIHGYTEISGIDVTPILTNVNEVLAKIYACVPPDTETGIEEDYTQYAPRSHYLGNDTLEAYFRTITWLERQRFYLGDDTDSTIAAILGYILANNQALHDSWSLVRTFFISLNNDSLGRNPLEIDTFMGQDEIISIIYGVQKYLLLEDSSLRDRYMSAFENPDNPDSEYALFFDSGFSMDLDTMVKTVGPENVTGRYFPNSLDIATTVFDSLTAYEEHQDEMDAFQGEKTLQAVIDDFIYLYDQKPETEWINSVYNYMLYSLRSLSYTPAGNIPEFMQNSYWEREKLNTQLAAWTELHSNNIIYPEATATPTAEPTAIPSPTPYLSSPPTVPPEPYYVVGQYKCANPSLNAVNINPHFNIINNGPESLPLKDITLHYYYTKEGDETEIFEVDYALVGRSHVTGYFYDGYVEIGFTADAGNLEPNSQTGEIQVRIHKSDWSIYDQSNDKSFDGSITDYTDWVKISIFYNGIQIWGEEPIQQTPETTISPNPTSIPTEPPSVTEPPVDTPVPTNVPTPDPTPIDTPTPTPTPIPQGYVEPYPEFYYRVKMMCNTVIQAMLAAEFTPIHLEKFIEIYQWADTFESLATRILEDTTPLSTEELIYIKNWGYEVDYFFTDINFVPEFAAKTNVITDIFNYEDVILHEAVGMLNPVIIFFEHPGDDTEYVGIGYVMSYYELPPESDFNRLTDEDWEIILQTTNPERPAWTSGFLEN